MNCEAASYCCIFKREDAKDILRKLSPFLDEEWGRHFADLDWAPASEKLGQLYIGENAMIASGLAGLKPNSYGIIPSMPLDIAFAINLEKEWDYVVDKYGFGQENGKTCFGYYSLSFQAGEKYVWLEMETDLELMTIVMCQSELLRQMWRDYAEISGAVLAYLDTTFSPKEILYPVGCETIFADSGSLGVVDGGFSVDHFTNYALSYLKPATPKPPVLNRQEEIDAEWGAMVAGFKQRLRQWNPFRR